MSSLQSSLQAPYSSDIWTGLLRTLFSSSAELFSKPAPISDPGFNGVFTKVLQLGDLKTADGKIAVLLDIEVLPKISLSRNRAGIRHLAARLIDGTQRQAILAAFHSPASPDWRFSFIIREKTFDIATGETRTTETPACRFTYLLGPNEKCRTAAERFATLNGTTTTLKDIETAFKVDQLTKEFYSELSDWYFWALTRVRFPDDEEKNEEKRNATMTIRLITRLIFVWFLKKKGLIPECLFNKSAVDDWLNNSDSTGSTYYKAVLQNLFFATLNFDPKEGQRGFVEWGKKGVLGYRYLRFFKRGAAEKFLDACKDIPFLNGGLFENLDKHTETPNPVRIDCFSNLKENEPRLAVPDDLFFSQEQIVNLSAFYDDKKRTAVKVKGLFEILNAYNFTVEESTPYDKDVALDPELLGQVFENLLASYNPETKTTARKQTGSFYTPREIVQYMVDESLVAHLKQTVGADLEPEYRKLTRYGDENLELTEKQKAQIVNALTSCRILDPACGSGAFPMGILQQLVHILNRLDPDNRHLKAEAIKQVQEEVNQLGDDSADVDENMEKMQETLKLFDEAATRPDYARKLLLIENSIYGVDIQPVAVQISKLRFFISLVVEQNPKEEIRPLPNLETNFVAANTLINIDKPDLLTDDPQVKVIEKDLKANRHRHFFARRTSVKQKCQKEDKRLREKLKNRLVVLATQIDQETIDKNLVLIGKLQEERSKFSEEVWEVRENKTLPDLFGTSAPEQQTLSLQVDTNKEKRDRIDASIRACETKIAKEYAKAKGNPFTTEAEKLANWDPYDQNASSEFFDSEWMFGITDGFDLVIGNPPYVRQESIKDQKPALKAQNFESFSGIADLFVYFYERGIKLLSESAHLCFITSNKYLRSGYGEALRKYLATKTKIDKLIDFGDAPVFEAIAYPSIMLTQRREPSPAHKLQAFVWTPGPAISEFPERFEQHRFSLPQASLRADGWQLEQKAVIDLLDKLRASGKPLGEYVGGKFYRGILTGLNEAFVVDRATRDQLIAEDPSSADLLKPFLRGRDVKRWQCNFADQYLIKIESSENKQHPWSDLTPTKAEKCFATTYPAIYAHFKPMREKLITRTDQGRFFWELRSCDYWGAFDECKIVYPNICKRNEFAWDNEGFLTNQKAFIIPTSDKVLFAILNSSVVFFLFTKWIARLQNEFFEPSAIFMEKFPIPPATPEQQATITDLVVRILTARTADPAADITALESEIDRHVYAIYHLTPDEIEIVEGAKQ